jgi:hypothetical protein
MQIDPTSLTFGQREGLEPLPVQLEPGEISQQIRAGLWAIIRNTMVGGYDLNRGYTNPVRWALLEFFIRRDHRMIDEFPERYPAEMERWVKKKFTDGSCVDVLNFVDHFIQSVNNRDIKIAVGQVLSDGHSAYRVIDGRIGRMSSDEEAATVSAALQNTKQAYGGAHQHLTDAVKAVTAGDYAGCVAKSIHAVESTARKIAPPGSQDLDAALSILKDKIGIHGALKSAFTKLYGYASDEEGIRHALVFQDAPEVDEADALFMLGACAAFVSYLAAKSRQAMLA